MPTHCGISPAAKGYDCAFCDKSTKIGKLAGLINCKSANFGSPVVNIF